MNFFRYLGFLALVTFISGSIVAMAAKDLTRKLGAPSEQEIISAKKLVDALRGDELFAVQGKYAAAPEVPVRSKGGLLPDYDMKKIKGFLVKQLGADESTASTSTEAESTRAESTRAESTRAKPAEAGKY
jgi:hypothetical protein